MAQGARQRGFVLQPLQLRVNLVPTSEDRVSQVVEVPRHGDGGSTRASRRDRHDTLALRQAAGTGAQRTHVQSQKRGCSIERVSVHAQPSRGLALVALVFSQRRNDECFSELSNGFVVGNPGFVHLAYEGVHFVSHVHDP